MACGYPGKLELSAKAMGLKSQKDMEGQKAMIKLSKPRGRVQPDGSFKRWSCEEFPAVYKTMYHYCGKDVDTEREAGMRLPYLVASEEKQYWYDQLVADRGVPLNQNLCRASLKIVAERKKELNVLCKGISGLTPTQTVELRRWVNRNSNLGMEDLKRESVEAALKSDGIPSQVKKVLSYRLEGSKSSTSKYQKALRCVCNDGTLKGARQFYGAHTGRWAGRGVQLDNLPRVTVPDIEEIVEIVQHGHSWLVESCFNDVMGSVSNAVRSMIVAEPVKTKLLSLEKYNKALYVCDFKSIESRLLHFNSGQESTLQEWRDSDNGTGVDVYVSNAADMFGINIDGMDVEKATKLVGKEHRYWGKIAELSLGYEGGTGALLRATAKNNANFADIFNIMYRNATDEQRSKVNWIWIKMGTGNEKAFKAARFVVEKWRAKNKKTVKMWKMYAKCALKAVQTGKMQTYRGVRFKFNKLTKMLDIYALSGGNPLHYPEAHVKIAKNIHGDLEPQLRAHYYAGGKVRRWMEYHPYGGLITENIIQKEARDVMGSRFGPLEKAKFILRHTIHDELIATSWLGRLKEFLALVPVTPDWATGCPIAVEGWSGFAYKKGE
jgi:DNA polymerase